MKNPGFREKVRCLARKSLSFSLTDAFAQVYSSFAKLLLKLAFGTDFSFAFHFGQSTLTVEIQCLLPLLVEILFVFEVIILIKYGVIGVSSRLRETE